MVVKPPSQQAQERMLNQVRSSQSNLNSPHGGCDVELDVYNQRTSYRLHQNLDKLTAHTISPLEGQSQSIMDDKDQLAHLQSINGSLDLKTPRTQERIDSSSNIVQTEAK